MLFDFPPILQNRFHEKFEKMSQNASNKVLVTVSFPGLIADVMATIDRSMSVHDLKLCLMSEIEECSSLDPNSLEIIYFNKEFNKNLTVRTATNLPYMWNNMVGDNRHISLAIKTSTSVVQGEPIPTFSTPVKSTLISDDHHTIQTIKFIVKKDDLEQQPKEEQHQPEQQSESQPEHQPEYSAMVSEEEKPNVPKRIRQKKRVPKIKRDYIIEEEETPISAQATQDLIPESQQESQESQQESQQLIPHDETSMDVYIPVESKEINVPSNTANTNDEVEEVQARRVTGNRGKKRKGTTANVEQTSSIHEVSQQTSHEPQVETAPKKIKKASPIESPIEPSPPEPINPFSYLVSICPREEECKKITSFVTNMYNNLDNTRNIMYIQGTNGQGKSKVTKEIFEAAKIEKYSVDMGGFQRNVDILSNIYGQIFKCEPPQKTDSVIREAICSYFNGRKAPSLLLLDEFNPAKMFQIVDKLKSSKVILIIITNDTLTPKVKGHNELLVFEPYEHDQITKILIRKYEGRVDSGILEKVMTILKNNHDLRKIFSFVGNHLLKPGLTMGEALSLCKKHLLTGKNDRLAGLTQLAIEVLVVMCCVVASHPSNEDVSAEEFQNMFKEITGEDCRSNMSEIRESIEQLAQEGHIAKKGVSGDVTLLTFHDTVLKSSNAVVKGLLANRK